VWIATADRGVYAYDTIGNGDAAWIHEDASDGLPSNAVNDLALGPGGEVWIATDAGAAVRDPAGNWTTWNVANGALPGDEALAVAADPKSGVWVGTNASLAVRHVDDWEHLHATGTGLSIDRVTHLTTTADRLWATTADHRLARRDVLTGPIGVNPPAITSFSPTQAGAGSLVTITGANFDDMVLANNQVTIGDRPAGRLGYPTPAQVVSATFSQLVIRVPDDATSGRIHVVSHNLPGESATDLMIGPGITGLSDTCVGPGDELVISGGGFFGSDGSGFADVRIGNGPWNDLVVTPMGDRQTAGSITYHVRATDRTGVVWVRNSDGLVASGDIVRVGSLEIDGWRIQQGIQGYPMIWGKRTLVHLDFDATGCDTHVTRGILYWKHRDGSETLASDAYLAAPGGQSVPLYEADDPTIRDDQGLDFVARFGADALSDPFPLSQFVGVRGVIKNGQVVLAEFDIPASEFGFVDPGIRFQFVYMAVLPGDNLSLFCDQTAADDDYDCTQFWNRAYAGMAHAARILPQQDYNWRWGSQRWFVPAGAHTKWPNFINLNGDAYDEVTGHVDDFIDPDPWELAIALIDERLLPNNASPGKAPHPGSGSTGAVFNNFRVGAIWAHESGHMLDLVNDDEANYDHGNDKSGHSRYDEGVNHDDPDNSPACQSGLTLMQACRDQLGFIPFVVRLDSGAPFHFPRWPNCHDDRPKALMSYADGRWDDISFLEPLDYSNVLGRLDFLEAVFGLGRIAGVDLTLRVKGDISLENEVDVSLSYVEPMDIQWSVPSPGSPWRLVLRAANRDVLVDLPFAVSFDTSDGGLASYRFGLRAPFSARVATAEIVFGDEVLWFRRVSANPPAVSFVSPAGGEYDAANVVEVAWNATDADGDPLQFALDYSGDGVNWEKLPQYLLDDTYDWTPGHIVASDNARLRLRVSDGFHTTTAISAPFALRPAAPIAMILQPKHDETFTEGAELHLVGASRTSEGPDAGRFRWFLDGNQIGTEREATHTLASVGTHTVRLDVATGAGSDRRTGRDEVTIEVIADYDRDGLPNEWELRYRLNPLDLDDAWVDSDGDKLTNRTEHRLGTNPRDRDTDGDGEEDGDEILAGGDPTDGGSLPAAGPILRVGADRVGFSVESSVEMPDGKSFWVTNSGIGELAWTANDGAAWLEVDPVSGDAPTEVTLEVDPSGLEAGEYTAQVVFTAAAADSPRVVDVRLTVGDGDSSAPRFIRGDCNSDGELAISDAIFLLSSLFTGGRDPGCMAACDGNGDGGVEISDPIYLLSFLFLGGPAPDAPHPACGEGGAADDALGCETVPPACR